MVFRKTLARLRSLEQHVGAVYVHKEDYKEHQADSDGWGGTIERRLKDVEKFVEEAKKVTEKGKK